MSTTIEIQDRQLKQPIQFEEFFQLDKEETVSPFIIPKSRSWGANLTLKSSIFAACLLFVAFVISFFPTLLPVAYLLLVAVYFFVGIPALIEALQDLAALEINIDILMTLAAFSSVLIGSAMEGALLLVLFALSGSMEDYVTSKAKSDISALHKLSPTRATVIESDGTLIERSLRDIAVGTHILVKAGQVVPLDGVVFDGASSVNMVHLTGENLPVTKKVADEVPAGARNLEGALKIKVTRSNADSTLARIIQLVTQAQEERPTLQRWFDKLSKTYATSIILLSAFFALTLPWVVNIPFLGTEGSVYRALAFLIAASPCALIIAIPIAYLSAIGACARKGILLKGGITLDALAKCKAIAFDKTGTLTTGNLTLEGVISINTCSNENIQEALAIAYALEKNAVHPIAKAIVAYGDAEKLPEIKLKEFRSVPGSGLQGIAKTRSGESKVFVGNADFIIAQVDDETGENIKLNCIKPQEDGELIAVLLVDKNPFILRFRDTLRTDIKATVDELHKQHKLNIVMLTGDHENSARKIAKELGIDEYYANLLPEDKLHRVSEMSSQYGLAMIGDGVNDAPALARASVGICMGKIGSTAAIDASDVVLLQDNIESIGWLMNKAHQTERVVKQNLILATVAIFVASIPAVAGFVPLWLAVVMHEGGTVLVGLNGLRLLRR